MAIEKNGHGDVVHNEDELSVKSRLCVRGDCVLRVAALSVRKSAFGHISLFPKCCVSSTHGVGSIPAASSVTPRVEDVLAAQQ
ncbi:hypothetical protein K4A87_06120 [Xanthomonas fragariae]|uniref:hypothetical protein n=1 Tax=Xanthomonas fragariae TaxID=48664 RepID=UPI001ABECB50|nr:hypothetical protein [Xanthomonas fragariae]UKR53506.1 hypothetical protein K4A87_06120 [Xanthomonas fragariae]